MKAIYTPEERKARRKASWKKWQKKTGYNWRKRNPERAKKKRLEVYAKNREAIRAYQKQWSKDHPETGVACQKAWREKNPEYMPRYYQEHKQDYIDSKKRRNAIPEKRAKYRATRKHYKKTVLNHNIQYQIKGKLRGRIKMALKNNALGKAKKSCKSEELLGCSIDYFKSYIAAKFVDGMTWANHAHDTWHLDHVKACKHFDLRDPEQQKECFNYKNYQPLWGPENLSKGIKMIQFPLTTQPNKAEFSPEISAQLGH